MSKQAAEVSEGAWIVQWVSRSPGVLRVRQVEKSGKGPPRAKAFRQLEEAAEEQETAKSLQEEPALHVP